MYIGIFLHIIPVCVIVPWIKPLRTYLKMNLLIIKAAVIYAWSYGRIIDIQSNLRRKKLHRTNQGSIFLGGSFSNRYNVRVKYLTWNSIRPKFAKNTSMQNPVKSLKYIKSHSLSSPDLLKFLAILSDTTVRRSRVDQKTLKTTLKIRKRPHFSRWSTIVLFTSFSKTLLTTEKRLTRWKFLAEDLSSKFSTFLNTRTINQASQQYGKQDSFRHILKSSTSVHESSSSRFLRTTTAIQSGRHTFDESSFVMIFLNILGVMEILCSFRLGLEETTGNKIR